MVGREGEREGGGREREKGRVCGGGGWRDRKGLAEEQTVTSFPSSPKTEKKRKKKKERKKTKKRKKKKVYTFLTPHVFFSSSFVH